RNPQTSAISSSRSHARNRTDAHAACDSHSLGTARWLTYPEYTERIIRIQATRYEDGTDSLSIGWKMHRRELSGQALQASDQVVRASGIEFAEGAQQQVRA